MLRQILRFLLIVYHSEILISNVSIFLFFSIFLLNNIIKSALTKYLFN